MSGLGVSKTLTAGGSSIALTARLLDGTTCWTVRCIGASEFERPSAIVAATGVERRSVVRDGQQVLFKKPVEGTTCGIQLHLGLLRPPLCHQHVGETPLNLRLVARECGQEQLLRVVGSALTRVDLCEGAHAPSRSSASRQLHADTRWLQSPDPVRLRGRQIRSLRLELAKRVLQSRFPKLRCLGE